MLTRGPRLGMSLLTAGRTNFADVENRLMAIGHAEATRAVQVLPLGLELTVTVEDLHPVVLTVGDVDPTIGVTADVVDDIELAFTGAGLTPRHQQLSVRRVFVDAWRRQGEEVRFAADSPLERSGFEPEVPP